MLLEHREVAHRRRHDRREQLQLAKFVLGLHPSRQPLAGFVLRFEQVEHRDLSREHAQCLLDNDRHSGASIQ